MNFLSHYRIAGMAACLFASSSLIHAESFILAEVKTAGTKDIFDCDNPYSELAFKDLSEHFEVLSLDASFISNQATDSSGNASFRVQAAPIGIVRKLDSCSARLFNAFFSGQPLDITITTYALETETGEVQTQSVMTLSNVVIAAINQGAESGVEDASGVRALNLETITVQPSVFNLDVSPQGQEKGSSFGWDFVNNSPL